MAQWGSIAEWLTIAAASLIFIVVHVVAYALLRRDVVDNKARINTLTSELISIKNEHVAVKTLAACLDRADEAEEEIEKIKQGMVTISMHRDSQAHCRGHLQGLIEANKKDVDGTREDIKEMKNMVRSQAAHINNMAVAVGQLSTVIEERVPKKASPDQRGSA